MKLYVFTLISLSTQVPRFRKNALYTANIGKIAGGYTLILNVFTLHHLISKIFTIVCFVEAYSPKEGDGRCSLYATPINIPSCARNDAAHRQTDDDRYILEERRAEQLRQHDTHERQEPQADEFGGAPWQGSRRVYVRAEREEAGGRTVHAVVRPPAPVGDSGGTDEGCADEEDHCACYHWRENPLEDAYGYEGEEHFEEGAY